MPHTAFQIVTMKIFCRSSLTLPHPCVIRTSTPTHTKLYKSIRNGEDQIYGFEKEVADYYN